MRSTTRASNETISPAAWRIRISDSWKPISAIPTRWSKAIDAGTDVIVHLAARAGVRPSIAEPVLYMDVNLNGTVTLLEIARQRRIGRFVFASSSSVYGNNEKVPFSEEDNVDFPISPYAATKKAGELICHTYHHLYGMPITCLRFFTVYGPRQRPDLAIHKFARLIEEGKPIPVFGDGTMMRDFTYIDDILNGIVAAIDRCTDYQIYNLGESQPISVTDLITELENALGKKAIRKYLPTPAGGRRANLRRRDEGRNPARLQARNSHPDGPGPLRGMAEAVRTSVRTRPARPS